LRPGGGGCFKVRPQMREGWSALSCRLSLISDLFFHIKVVFTKSEHT